MEVNAENIKYTYPCKNGLKNVSIQVHPKEFVTLIGPNGSGKSTLLKNIYRVLKPEEGIVYLNGKDASKMTAQEAARSMAVVFQESSIAFDYTVEEMALMGRNPHHKWNEKTSREDEKKVNEILKKLGLYSIKNKSFNALSGGEKQRVLFARALIQDTKLLILDEPCNHLDIFYQFQLFDIIKEMDITVLTALHDLNMAMAYSNRIYVLKKGQIAAQGDPNKIITPSLISDVFQVQSRIFYPEPDHKPVIVYTGGLHENNS